MTYYCSCYYFKVSTTGTTCASLETGGGIAYQPCYRHGSRVVPRISQGVGVVPTFKVLGLSI